MTEYIDLWRAGVPHLVGDLMGYEVESGSVWIDTVVSSEELGDEATPTGSPITLLLSVEPDEADRLGLALGPFVDEGVIWAIGSGDAGSPGSLLVTAADQDTSIDIKL